MRTESQIRAEKAYKERKREERKKKCAENGVEFKTHKWRKRLPGESDLEFRRRYDREFHAKHKKSRNAWKAEQRKLNPELYRAKDKAWKDRRQDAHIRAWYLRNWCIENKEYKAKKDSEYVKRNRRRITKRQCAYIANRRKHDIQYRITIRLRSRVWDALQPQSAIKAARTMELLGCDSAFFKSFLEFQFSPAMSWDNYGTFWEIDHIMPVSGFDLTVPDNQRLAFHYSNCRPLICDDNNFKADKSPGPHQPWLL